MAAWLLAVRAVQLLLSHSPFAIAPSVPRAIRDQSIVVAWLHTGNGARPEEVSGTLGMEQLGGSRLTVRVEHLNRRQNDTGT